MAQLPLKRFDRPLLRNSLSNSLLVTLIFYRGRVMGDKSIVSWANSIGTKVLLGREYVDSILLRGLFFQA